MRRYFLSGLLVLADMVLLVMVAFFSLYIRFDGNIEYKYIEQMTNALPFLLCAYLIMLGGSHLYTRIWRYAGMREVGAVLRAATGGAILFYICMQIIGNPLPRSIYIITYLLATGGIGLGRLLLHYAILRFRQCARSDCETIPVLIVGAGDAGAVIAREISQFHKKSRKIVGFIDDDLQKQNHLMGGVRILGTRTDIPRIVNTYGVKEIIIAMPSVRHAVIRDIIEICAPLKCQINTLPGVYQLLDHEVLISRLHPVSIEDLLARDEIHLDTTHIQEYLTGKVVLVSGAGGSIGSEICRQVMRRKPKQLILMGHGENSIYLIHQELSQEYGTAHIVPVIASVRDPNQLEGVFSQYRPDVVFHAAAHKHVPLMEIQPMAAVVNNIFGTRNIAKAAGQYGAERFIMISTDKAVNPTSVMGATKQVAEKVVHVMNDTYPTTYITVRFGNVLGSRGSVIPLFRRQLAAGGPLTVTDPEMTRYFMTIPEASQLVLQAGAMGKGGEVFLLDMGEPVKIMDLARNMIRLSGYEPEQDIQIQITGLRPGEKLYEELLTAGEGTSKTEHTKIFEAPLEQVDGAWLKEKINAFMDCRNDVEVIHILQEIIPTYHPNHNI